jgi:hypothetical protein
MPYIVLYLHIVLYQHIILYPRIVLYQHIIQYPRIVHYNEKNFTRANTLLLYSPFASPLTMIMGQSFPKWEQCWEH